jgi:hypothetical protein
MIIYGHRKRETEVAEGEFSCPRCQTRRAYKHKRVDRVLTLFFIPTIRLGRLGEYVECQVCRTTFTMDVLSQGQPASSRPTIAQERQGWVRAVLGAIFAGFGLLIGLFATISQLTDPAGPGSNWQGFIGVMILCPFPLMAAGTAVLISGIIKVRRVRQARQGFQ